MQKLVVVGGSPATGKSTMAKYIEEKTQIKRVSMDEIKEALFDVGGYRDREWSKDIGRVAWPVFKRVVEMHLEREDSLIIEATFLWADDKDWLHALKNRHNVDLVQVWMTADPRMTRDRFYARANQERHPGHCDALESVIGEFQERFFNLSFIPHPIDGRTIVIETTDFESVDHGEVIRFVNGS